jgi:hypothetical protein
VTNTPVDPVLVELLPFSTDLTAEGAFIFPYSSECSPYSKKSGRLLA